jgi:hypothetical protein
VRKAAATIIHKNGLKDLGKMFIRMGQAFQDEENGTRSGHTVPSKVAKNLERKIMAEYKVWQNHIGFQKISQKKE